MELEELAFPRTASTAATPSPVSETHHTSRVAVRDTAAAAHLMRQLHHALHSLPHHTIARRRRAMLAQACCGVWPGSDWRAHPASKRHYSGPMFRVKSDLPAALAGFVQQKRLWHFGEVSTYRLGMCQEFGGSNEGGRGGLMQEALVSDLQWFVVSVPVGALVECLDVEGSWCRARVVGEHLDAGRLRRWVKVRFLDWDAEYDEWIPVRISTVGEEDMMLQVMGNEASADPADNASAAGGEDTEDAVPALVQVGGWRANYHLPDTYPLVRLSPPGTFVLPSIGRA